MKMRQVGRARVMAWVAAAGLMGGCGATPGTGRAADAPAAGGKKVAEAAAWEAAWKEPVLVNGVGTIKLPAPAAKVVFAGGGRYLVAHLKTIESVAVVDLSAGKVAGLIGLPKGECQVAAGLTKVFVASKENNSLTRYDLETREKELTVLAPDGGIQSLCMGFAAIEPLVVGAGKKTLLMDPDILQGLPVEWEHFAGANSNWPAPHLRASADGRAVVAWGGGWAGMEVLSVDGERVVDRRAGGYVHDESPRLSFDGSMVFAERKAWDSQLQEMDVPVGGVGIASAGASFYLSLDENKRAEKDRGTLKFFLAGSSRPIWTIKDIEPLTRSALPAEERIFYVPALKLLAGIGAGNNQVLLRRVDLKEALDGAGIDYLFVSSSPVGVVKLGKAYGYAMEVASKRGGVVCSLASGPEGMTVSKVGKVSWQVPADFDKPSVRVVLSVTDGSGQQEFQAYVVRVQGVKKAERVVPEKGGRGRGGMLGA